MAQADDEVGFGDRITDAFFSTVAPAFRTGFNLIKQVDASITAASKAREFDQSIKEKIEKEKKDAELAAKTKLTGLDLAGNIEGFVGTPEQELAYKIKAQTQHYTEFDIDVTDASPENFNKAVAMLGSEKDVNKKLSAALAVTSIATQMSILNMGNYTAQARAALGIDHLGKQLEAMMVAEMRSPMNPRNGSHSIEVQTQLDKLSTLNTKVPDLARDYAMMDPAIAAPLAAAQAVLKSLPIIERLEVSRERAQQKTAAINTITDVEAKNYAMMTGSYDTVNWNSPGSVFKAKSAFFQDKEFQKLTQQGLLSIDDPLTSRTLYAFSDSPIDKSRNLAIMQRIEADSLGVKDPNITLQERQRRESTLQENMNAIKAVYSSELPKNTQTMINNQIMLEMAGAGTKEKASRRKELEIAQKDSMLQSYLIGKFSSDVSQWKGLDTVNPLVGQTLATIRKTTGKHAVPLESFISEFLVGQSDLTYSQRLKLLQQYIYSSANVSNNSAVLPDISGEVIYNKSAPSTARIWLNSVLRGTQ
jgi:hypothetical protein